MSLSIATRTVDDACVITVSGEVDVANAAELRMALDEALGAAAPIRINLAEVPYIDSTGIGVLVGAAHRAADAHTSLVVINPQRNVVRVLSMLGVCEELGIDATANEAD